MQYNQPPSFQPQPYQPQPYRQIPPRRRMSGGKIVAIVAGSVVGVIILLGAIGAALAPSPQYQNHPAAQQAAGGQTGVAAPQVTAPAKPKAKVLATFHGTGDENTPKFTVSGSWKLKWSYNCSSFGADGNFIVLEDNSFSSGAQVNEEGKTGKGATWSYSDSGRHYLTVNSECNWTVKVVGTK